MLALRTRVDVGIDPYGCHGSAFLFVGDDAHIVPCTIDRLSVQIVDMPLVRCVIESIDCAGKR